MERHCPYIQGEGKWLATSSECREKDPSFRGFAKKKKFQKSEFTTEVGGVGGWGEQVYFGTFQSPLQQTAEQRRGRRRHAEYIQRRPVAGIYYEHSLSILSASNFTKWLTMYD